MAKREFSEPAVVKEARKALDAKLAKLAPRMVEMSDWIYANPEAGFLEFQAADLLAKELQKHKFEVTMGAPGLEKAWPEFDRLKYVGGLPKTYDGAPWLPTAFLAKYKGKSEHPVMAIILEYDALRGNPPFHGCQHNMQGPTGLGAAVALAETLEEKGYPGSVWVIGAPAEEIGPPTKAALAFAGMLDGVDFAMRTHGMETQNETVRHPAGFSHMHIEQMKYTFHGKSAHAAKAWGGVSALDPILLLLHGVEMLREHSEPQFRFHWTITEGGVAPNIVPEKASVIIWVRHFIDKTREGNVSPKKAKEMIDAKAKAIDRLAQAMADGTGTTVEIDHYGSYVPGISVGAFNDLSYEYGLEYGGVNPSESQLPNDWDETGYMTLRVPGVMVRVGTEGINPPKEGHSQANADYTVTPDGHKSLINTMEVLAAIGLRVMMDKEQQKKITEEHAELVKKYNE
jgi:amidohydrolase